MKLTNLQMEMMLETMKPLLPHRDKIGYIAARNSRILMDALKEYFIFKENLLKKYGEKICDKGNKAPTLFITPDSENFEAFKKEFEPIRNVEQEITLMTMPYKEVIGLLNGEEILSLDWMLTE